ncbi:sensor histidine kinase [Hymenobacter koreensis]|uniref:Oxygen sensor histidine kinase NreB n=1 Tax=Hymenobacter koreensis TaxID=1084523 RepID=A0ABP8J7T1_9BACT
MDKPAEVEFAWLLFGGVGVMLLLATTTVMIMIIYQRRAYRQQVRLQQLALEYQKEMIKSVIGSQESERERITRDLHDEIGASLSVAKLFVNQIQYEAPSPDVAKLAEQATDIISETVRSIREIVHNLSSANLNKLGLRKALETIINRLAATGIEVQVHLDPSVDSLSEAKQLAVYRIAQEALGNTIKHAGATHVSLRIEPQSPWVLLSVTDNGRGFDQGQALADRPPGMGLGGMQARAELHGGQLSVVSAVGQGTHVRLRLPQ